MPAPLSRRSLLFGLAGATLAACRAPLLPRRQVAAPVSLVNWGGFSDGVVAAFERSHPDIHFVTGSTSAKYRLDHPISVGAPGSFGDLTAALRKLNFDPSVLVPGTMAAWTNRGRIIGVPISEIPWGVAWRTDAFAAAEIPTPTADWTYDDFCSACTELQALATSGRMKGLRAALGPVALAPKGTNTSGGMFQGPKGWGFAPALARDGLWQAFAWGFGGVIAQKGRFTLTDPATVGALQQLIDLARAFCVPPEDVAAVPIVADHSAWTAAVWNLFAIALVPFGAGGLPSVWASARLPRFPFDPVIPTQSTAVAVSASKAGAPPPPADAPETLAAAEFGVWLNSAAALGLTAVAQMAPAVTSAQVQTRFWSGPGPGKAAVVGDWQHFRGIYDGFPDLYSEDFTASSLVASALSDAIAGTSPLPDALAQAQSRMNAEVLQ